MYSNIPRKHAGYQLKKKTQVDAEFNGAIILQVTNTHAL